jgi:hypothetical protein
MTSIGTMTLIRFVTLGRPGPGLSASTFVPIDLAERIVVFHPEVRVRYDVGVAVPRMLIEEAEHLLHGIGGRIEQTLPVLHLVGDGLHAGQHASRVGQRGPVPRGGEEPVQLGGANLDWNMRTSSLTHRR